MGPFKVLDFFFGGGGVGGGQQQQPKNKVLFPYYSLFYSVLYLYVLIYLLTAGINIGGGDRIFLPIDLSASETEAVDATLLNNRMKRQEVKEM